MRLAQEGSIWPGSGNGVGEGGEVQCLPNRLENRQEPVYTHAFPLLRWLALSRRCSGGDRMGGTGEMRVGPLMEWL